MGAGLSRHARSVRTLGPPTPASAGTAGGPHALSRWPRARRPQREICVEGRAARRPGGGGGKGSEGKAQRGVEGARRARRRRGGFSPPYPLFHTPPPPIPPPAPVRRRSVPAGGPGGAAGPRASPRQRPAPPNAGPACRGRGPSSPEARLCFSLREGAAPRCGREGCAARLGAPPGGAPAPSLVSSARRATAGRPAVAASAGDGDRRGSERDAGEPFGARRRRLLRPFPYRGKERGGALPPGKVSRSRPNGPLAPKRGLPGPGLRVFPGAREVSRWAGPRPRSGGAARAAAVLSGAAPGY